MVVLTNDVKTVSVIVACVALLAIWCTEKAATAELRAQVSSRRDDRREMESLRREQERLRARQRAIDEQAEREALLTARNGWGEVFVLDRKAQVARRTRLRVQGFDGEALRVSGLPAGAEVITAGAGFVADGQKVKVAGR